MVTNCIHLANAGRNLKPAKVLYLASPSLKAYFIDSRAQRLHHFYMESTQYPQSDIKTDWIETLALEELNMDETGIIHIDDHLNPTHLLEESSIQFMDQLRERVDIYVGKFNEYRGAASGSHIKIFKISNTINDFMLFRNSLRLVFARRANDLISIGFLSSGKDVFAARLNKEDQAQHGIHEIRAHVGPFNKISWKFQGEAVDMDALVKHYLSEFIRHSSR